MQAEHTEIMLLEQRVDVLEKRDEDKEERLRRIERNMYIGMGAIALLQIILKFAKV